VQGGEDREERKREDLQAKCTDRTVCFHLIYYKAQFYGCSPNVEPRNSLGMSILKTLMLYFLGEEVVKDSFGNYFCKILIEVI
jgi:hypothetical protein